MITIDSVTKRYGDLAVVDQVSLTIPEGGITSIIGANGAGKSTLLGMVSRLLPMDGGTVHVDELDVHRSDSAELARRLAILRQENVLNVRLTVEDLVAFGRYPHCGGRPGPVDKEHVERAMEYLDVTQFRDRYLDQLSGGQRQRAFVAMVLCQDTKYILLDEPLNNLDMAHAVAMMKLLKRLATELDKTVIMVVHDINFASVWSDRIVALKDGKLAADGPTAEIMQTDVLAEVFGLHMGIHEIDGDRIGVYYRSPATAEQFTG